MAALSDHDRRDAEHASRAEVAILIQKYVRRMSELSKAYIKEALDDASRAGESVDGTAIGRAAAARAGAHYFLDSDPHEVIESSATHAIGPG